MIFAIFSTSILFISLFSLAYAKITSPKFKSGTKREAPDGAVMIKRWSGQCQFNGYKAGGADIEISDIDAPTATLQSNQIDTIVNIGKNGGALSQNAVDTITTFTDSMKKVGPKLAQSFGIIGVLGGVIAEVSQPGVGDVIAAMNIAMAELTTEVNFIFSDPYILLSCNYIKMSCTYI